MKVILAGHNLDQTIISRFRETLQGSECASDTGLESIDPDALTPETLSAAYARISRDPRPVPELRRDALGDVAAARQSNRRIVFGFGHASVAEHAVFNLDILDISRLAMEALELTRLGSYTEKSQRYILLERDFIVPAEIAGTTLERDFRRLLAQQQDGYRRAYQALIDYYRRTQPSAWASQSERRLLEGAAKEDARYFLGLSTTAQVGVTLNARILESTIRRLAADPLEEVRRLGAQMHGSVADTAPSLVRYTDATPHRRETPAAMRASVDQLSGPGARQTTGVDTGDRTVKLVSASPNGDDLLLTALIHQHSQLSWRESEAVLRRLDEGRRRCLVEESLRRMEVHETPPREFELPGFTFELILSASCFAQLKRHRMASLLCQPYAPGLGVTIPDSFAQAGLLDSFDQLRKQSEEVFAKILAVSPQAAAYALTNAHRRRVVFHLNARELYHLSRLRLDEHAQWDIRSLATEMIRQAQERMPLGMMLAAGKHDFDAMKARAVQ
ncbi:MAG: FAD-dependent thymidylate synthase [Candidatus Eisenbacteria sp.]|nr:FAD-dependent thymidylate synthase [Candidatus Eisenbacteria bacterium]